MRTGFEMSFRRHRLTHAPVPPGMACTEVPPAL